MNRSAGFLLVLILLLCTLVTGNYSWSKTIEVYNPVGINRGGVYVDKLLKKSMMEQKKKSPSLAGTAPSVSIQKITIRKDSLNEINDLFYRRGWTDGLPIIPPTKERVNNMLYGSDLSADFVLGSMPPMDGQVTIKKVAVNAVMAGCRPSYMPILLAAVESVMDPAFNLRGMATTTNPDVPMVIISGPIVTQLDINCSTNTLGRGWKANATIGRALHLIIHNVGGSWPGVTDMSCLGHPGDFSMCLAENSMANPWNPMHMELGQPEKANVVTVIGAEGTHNILGIGQSSQGYLKVVSDHLAGMDRSFRSVVLLIIAQDTANMLARDGWSKDAIKRSITGHAMMSYSRYKEKFIDTNMARLLGGIPSWVFENQDLNKMIQVPFIDQFLILVSGGPGEKSALIPGWSGSKAISKEIRLPSFWDELLEKEK